MQTRYSKVDQMRVITLSFSSIFEIGDSRNIEGYSKVYAVQRESELYYTSEGNFSEEIYRKPIPLPPINPRIHLEKMNLQPMIKVDNIQVTGASAASIIHIGSTHNVYLEARVKNIRQLESNHNDDEVES